MNKVGRTSTIFLIIFLVLLLSLTAITLFLFQKEREIRKAAEDKFETAQVHGEKISGELEEVKQQVFILESKKKEVEEKIEGLLDDLELERGLRREIKNESIALSQKVEVLTKEKEKIESEAARLKQRIEAMEDELAQERALRQEAQKTLEDLETQKALEAQKSLEVKKGEEQSVDDVQLDEIIVTPDKNPEPQVQMQEGKILKINARNNFVIISLGRIHLIENGDLAVLTREDEVLGEGKVSRVQRSMSVLDLLSPLTAKDVLINDKVVIKE